MGIKLIDAKKRKYRVSFWYRKKHYAWVITGNRKLAEDFESKKLNELAEGTYFPARQRPNLSFREAAEKFLTEYAKHKPSAKHFRYNTNSAIKFLGSKSIHDISPEDIRQYRANQAKLGMHPVTVNHRQKNIRRIFNWLEQLGLYSGKNPASGKWVPLENERPYWRRSFLSLEQYQKLLEVSAPRLRTIIITASHTGMRHGELRRIQKKDVDLDRCTIFIPKSKNGEPGSVPITATLFAVLAPIMRILPSPESNVLDFSNFDKLWDSAREKAGLLHEVWTEGMTRWQKVKSNKNFHFHDLRHTAASHAIMGSKDPYAVQSFLRLKTQSLMQRYAHLSPGHVRQAALTLDKQLPVSLTDPPISVPATETALIAIEPIRNPNIEPQPAPANS
jgi:integrase